MNRREIRNLDIINGLVFNQSTHIDVQPDVILLADVSDGVDGVEGAIDGGPGRAVHEERQVAFALVTNNQLL